MANVKYTSRNFYTDVMNGNITEQVKEYARESIKKMDEKNANRAKSQTPSQKANEVVKTEILAYMQKDTKKVYVASEVASALSMKSTQQATALLRQMKDSGIVSAQEYTPTGKKKDTVQGYTLVEE